MKDETCTHATHTVTNPLSMLIANCSIKIFICFEYVVFFSCSASFGRFLQFPECLSAPQGTMKQMWSFCEWLMWLTCYLSKVYSLAQCEIASPAKRISHSESGWMELVGLWQKQEWERYTDGGQAELFSCFIHVSQSVAHLSAAWLPVASNYMHAGAQLGLHNLAHTNAICCCSSQPPP